MKLLNIVVNILNYEVEILFKTTQSQMTFWGVTHQEHIYRRTYGLFLIWGRVFLFFTTPERTKPYYAALKKIRKNKYL